MFCLEGKNFYIFLKKKIQPTPSGVPMTPRRDVTPPKFGPLTDSPNNSFSMSTVEGARDRPSAASVSSSISTQSFPDLTATVEDQAGRDLSVRPLLLIGENKYFHIL